MNLRKSYKPTKNYVKHLGRVMFLENILWCSHSATGIAFNFAGDYCGIMLMGDSSAGTEWGKGHETRIGVFLNQELIVDTLLDEPKKMIEAIKGEWKEGIIKIVKLSESSDSTMGIEEIIIEGDEISAAKDSGLKIEFVGDSITCGYGVDGTLEDTYSTSNENSTLSYAYLCAQSLGADYSMVSFSGYGILSGYTGDGEINVNSLLPGYYHKLGRSYGTFLNGIKAEEILWNSQEFVPSIVVINLGTNDASYCGIDDLKGLEYQQKYGDFIKTIRQTNPKATIIASLGIMDDRLFKYLENAVCDYKTRTSDEKIFTLPFRVQLESDGYCVDYHPSKVTHEKAAFQLKTFIQERII